ncbi:MAG: hypothetical protein QW761_00125 [Candidatus Aenigmatarchaeota archaeon]
MFESAVVSLNWLVDMDAELASCVFMLILAVGLLWGTIEQELMLRNYWMASSTGTEGEHAFHRCAAFSKDWGE